MTEETGTEGNISAGNPSEEISTEFNLSRVFSLLSLIIGLLALGFISSLFISMDNRLENIEKNFAVSATTLDDRIASINESLSKQAFGQNTPVSGAKQLLVGSELSRTLFLMRYIAGDPSFSDAVRQRAAQVHAQADAMLKDLQTGK